MLNYPRAILMSRRKQFEREVFVRVAADADAVVDVILEQPDPILIKHRSSP